jgi:hypothetical protein
MIDPYNVLIGAGISRREVVVGAGVVFFWLVIDIVQFVDWTYLKFNPPVAISCPPTIKLTVPSDPYFFPLPDQRWRPM